MAVDSRGGGYDLNTDREMKRKKALGDETRQSVGAQATAQPGADPQAPASLGDLMSPSASRGAPASTPEDMERKVSRNREFLMSPETRDALTVFGISLMSTVGTGDLGSNIGRAFGAVGKSRANMAKAMAKMTKEEREFAMQERRLKIEERRLGMDEQELSQEASKKKARRTLFASLKGMTDEKLMQLASELAAEDDDEGARIAISMMKQSDQSGEATALIKQYLFDVGQGYKGTMQEWRQDNYKVTALETIRQKIATGLPLTPGEQKVYDDAIKLDFMTRFMLEHPEILGGAETAAPSGVPSATPAPAAPVEGTSGNVKFKVNPT